ncbi:MAG TPA: molybdopterin-dependent oxidoreductase [Actinotalea sp.]
MPSVIVGGAPADSELPPGQHVTTPPLAEWAQTATRVRRDRWTFTIAAEGVPLRSWTWRAFQAMPHQRLCVDLHSEAGWSLLATNWEGVPMRALFAGVDARAEFTRVETYTEFTTNLPLDDLLEMPTWIADSYEGRPIPSGAGGPARLLVPHLYLWKSARWVRAIDLSDRERPGTRERAGWHNYGDPWLEQRYRHH